MSEYEYLDLISTLRQESVTHQMAFFTIWSAFIVLIYFVGRKLSTLYVVPLTIIYTAFVVVTAFGFQVAMQNQYAVIGSYLAAHPSSALVQQEAINVRLIILGVDVVGWVMSILFLIHRRRVFGDSAE